MPYDASAYSYSSRIEALLALKDEASLLYAALEMRCAVEARIKEYLDPLDHIPKGYKKEYSVVKLRKSIDAAFPAKEQLSLFTITFPESQDEVTLRYIPVPKRLQDIAARAGDALHFPGEEKLHSPKWWENLRATIEEGSSWFSWVASGDLMGMPLLNPRNKQSNLRFVIRNDDPRGEKLQRLAQGAEHLIRVAYEPVPKAPPRVAL